jgi:Lrp/AsnC family leucine-responsive transcriptional regulator
MNAKNQLDDIDRNLLRLLQKNALLSAEQLGAEVGLSPTAAKRRVNRMRESGVILRDVAMVDPKSLGLEVFTLVQVNLERDHPDILQSFQRSIQQDPRIVQGFYATGDADFVLLVASGSLEEYERFTREIFWENNNIRSFKTMVVMNQVKVGFELPVGNEV